MRTPPWDQIEETGGKAGNFENCTAGGLEKILNTYVLARAALTLEVQPRVQSS